MKVIRNSHILIIATSAKVISATGERTGLWLEELTTPYYAFKDAGAQVTVASIAGGAIPIDPRSIKPAGENDASVERYLEDKPLQEAFSRTPHFGNIDANGLDAVFLPGGHGTMFDYPENRDLADLIERMDHTGKIVAAVCHGPAGLVSVRGKDGAPLVSGRTIAAFTDSEERLVGLDKAMPFLLESRLRQLGARFEHGEDFQPFAVRDKNLVTGQNPASATDTARLVLEALEQGAFK